MSLAYLSHLLSTHQEAAYIVLFLGMYFETLIGPSFFILGEPFLIAGPLLAGTGILNIWLVIISLYLGGMLGDSSSYFIGRALSKKTSSIFKENRKIFSLKNHERAKAFFDKHGESAVFFARIGGPVSWVMPFFAGLYEVAYPRFLIYNIPGVILGIGGYIVGFYFFGNYLGAIIPFLVHDLLWVLLALTLAVFTGYAVYRIFRNS